MPAIGSVRIPEPFFRRGVLKDEARGDAFYEGPLRFGWRPRIAHLWPRARQPSVGLDGLDRLRLCVRIRLPTAVSVFTQTRPLQAENRGFRGRVRRSVGG